MRGRDVKDRSLEELIAQVREKPGDNAAWEQLLPWLLRRLRGPVDCAFGQPADVNDVLQDACVKILQGLSELRSGDPTVFEYWARTIVRNCIQEVRRKRSGGPPGAERVDQDEMLEVPAPGPDLNAQVTARRVLPHVEEFNKADPSRPQMLGQIVGNGSASNGAEKRPTTGTERWRKSKYLGALRAYLHSLGVTWGDDE